MNKLVTRVLLSGLLAVLTVTITGCTVPSKTAAKLIDGDLVFVSCETFTFHEVLVVASDLEDWDADSTRAWVATGTGVVGPGDTIVYGVPPAGFRTDLGPRALPFEHRQIEFYLYFTPSHGASDVIFGAFDSRDLSSAYWLRHDGSHHDEACD